MELDQLMRFAHAYSKLGWAIQEQLDDIINGEHCDINPNALQEISKTMRGYNGELDEAIDDAIRETTAA
jgi:uncharacterized protein YukE